MNSANAQSERAIERERHGYSARERDMATLQCTLCDAALPAAAERRLLNPASEANADEHDFLATLVRPGHRFGTEAASASSQLP